MPICRSIRLLCVLATAATVCRAQVVTGLQPHGTMMSKGADVINVGNNNVFLNIPIISKQGRGTPFEYSISLNSSIWYPVNSGSSTSWMPVGYDGSALGWQGINPQGSQGASYSETVYFPQCASGYFTLYVYQPAAYLAPAGGVHAFSGAPIEFAVPAAGSSGCPNGALTPTTSTLATHDSSGYLGTMTAQGSGASAVISFKVEDAQGHTITPPVAATQGAYQGPLTSTDANGNQITGNFGQYTDTTGSLALSVLYQAASSGPPNPDGKVTTVPAQTTLKYNIPGGTASYQVIYGTYTVATNFGCAAAEYGPISTNLVSEIVAPDGGTYKFGYETTPGRSSYTTGRITFIQLPTGGTITYQYSGGNNNNGINCSDGSTPTLTRTTSDGISTFVRSSSGNSYITTVTDEKSNQSVYTFTADGPSSSPDFYESHRKVYQGLATGTPLQEVATCYNGATGNCDGQPFSLPATEIDSTSSFNGGSQRLTKSTYDSTGVVVTKVAQYNGSTLLESTTNAYTITPPLYELNSTTVADGSGNTVALTSYGYDEGTLTSTSSLPQHVSAPTARGNLTSSHVSIDGTPTNTLTTKTAYYDTGQPVSTTTPSGTTTYGYDSTQTFVQSTALPTPSSGVALATSATYDVASGAIHNSTGMNSGQTTTVTQYNSFLQPQTVTPVSGPQITASENSFVNSSDPAQSTTTQGSSTSTTQYDGYGRTSRVATYNGQSNAAIAYYQTDYCYDAAGLLSFQPLPYAGPGLAPQANSPKQCSGTGTSYTYDALGRLHQTITADGTATTNYANLTVQTTDVNGVQKLTLYDLLGRISGVCEISANSSMPGSGPPVACGMDIAGTGFLTTYAYNLATRTTTITQGTQTRTFQTDAAGRTIYTKEPERGVTLYSYAFNSVGLAVTRTRPSANQTSTAITVATTTQYDTLGRPVSVTYADQNTSNSTPNKQFKYDQASTNGGTAYNNGQLTNASTLNGSTVVSSTQLNYDILGNVSDSSQCMPNNCGNATFNVLRYYQNDPVLGSRTQESYRAGGSSGTRIDTNMTYTADGELLTMSNTLTGAGYNSGSILSNMQNSVNGPTSYTLGNGLNGVLQYDSLGRSSGISLCANSSTFGCSGGTQRYQMTQTVVGARVTAMNDTVLATNATPSYDEFNRLKGINYSTRAQAFTYTYDRYGNRWDQTITQGSGPSPQLSFNVANNQLTSAGYSYDAAGNMLTDGSHRYTYDAEGNVMNVDGSATKYIYDALNHRVRTTTTSADIYFTFNTDGLRVASWNAAAGTPTMLAAYAYWNGTPVATYTSTTVAYAQEDLLGTKRLITTSTGSTAATFQSLPFGDSFTPTGTDSDPSHFALLDHDTESSTDHAQFRQYNSTPGAWMSPDPYDRSYDPGSPQSLNRYTYGGNNPLSVIDPSGLDWEYVCKNPSSPGAGAQTGPQHADCELVWTSSVIVHPGPEPPCYADASCAQTQPSNPNQPNSVQQQGITGPVGNNASTSAPSNAPSNPQKSQARQQCEAAAAQQLDAASQQVSGAAILKQLPHDVIEGAVVGAAAGCAAGAAATSWTGPGAAGGCGAGALSGAGWGALWGVNLTFGRAIYDGTAALINYKIQMNACSTK